MSDNLNILTFDIEDWFHIEFENDINIWNSYQSRIEGNLDRIFGLLEKHDQNATFFCLGWIAGKYTQLIKRIDALGYEIGSHSYDHGLVYCKTPASFEEDLKKSIFTIEDAIGKKVRFFRAPAFSINEKTLWFFELIARYGIEIDSSVFPDNRDYGGFPGFSPARPVKISYKGTEIKEFPINIHNTFGLKVVFSGGGYFRLLPYYLIRKWANNSSYLMTYIHPRDIDPDQPVLQGLSMVRKFKSYVGLRNGFSKLDRFMHDFRFINLSQAVESINWDEIDTIHL